MHVLGFTETLDGCFVAPVERLIQDLPGDIVLSGNRDRFFVKRKVRETL
jgi:hypothetical protein